MELNLFSEDAAFSRLASGVKSKIGYAGKFVADQAVQLHGGMGMTDELKVGQADFFHQHPVRRSRVPPAAVCAARSGRLRRGKHEH
jgi:alkylation response protein AidB-like acyl-CoA dehydrogenase